MRHRIVFPVAGFLVISLVTIGCGGGQSKSTSVDSGKCSTVAAGVAQPGRQNLTAPTSKLPAGSVWAIDVKTNCGDFTIQVRSDSSPNAAASFVALAKSGFYDALPIHRLAPGFVIQGGDPATDGTGGPGYKTVDTPAASQQYVRGLVAMAKAGNEPSGTAGSQFFVVTGEVLQLPADYAVLGKVIKGMDVVDRISAQPIEAAAAAGQDGPPASPIVMSKLTVSKAG